jgi:hypothetical protein
MEYLGGLGHYGPVQLVRFLNRYMSIASRFDLTSIAVISDFIRKDYSATFIGMNRRDADLHIACGVRTSTVTPYTLRYDPDLVLLRHLRHRCLESRLPRQR